MVYISQRDSGLSLHSGERSAADAELLHRRCDALQRLWTIKQTVPPQTDELGYAVGDGKEAELTLLKRIPAVARHAQTLTTAQNAAGLRIADTLDPDNAAQRV